MNTNPVLYLNDIHSIILSFDFSSETETERVLTYLLTKTGCIMGFEVKLWRFWSTG